MIRFFLLMALFLASQTHNLSAQTSASAKLKDFRGTAQTLALLGGSSEFVDPAQKDVVLQMLRRQLNRYTRSYGESSIGSFKLGVNTNDQFYRPAVNNTLSDQQKAFLKTAAKENSIDIIALCSLREAGDQVTTEIEIQLFDSRIETLSAVERAQVTRAQMKGLEDLAFRIMNYLDKDGFVHPSPQDVLERPLTVQAAPSAASIGSEGGLVKEEEFSINPTDLGSGTLAGAPVIGGDKVPFWERWWFWTIVGGSLATAGGLSYYFFVVEKDPTKANITFQLPN